MRRRHQPATGRTGCRGSCASAQGPLWLLGGDRFLSRRLQRRGVPAGRCLDCQCHGCRRRSEGGHLSRGMRGRVEFGFDVGRGRWGCGARGPWTSAGAGAGARWCSRSRRGVWPSLCLGPGRDAAQWWREVADLRTRLARISCVFRAGGLEEAAGSRFDEGADGGAVVCPTMKSPSQWRPGFGRRGRSTLVAAARMLVSSGRGLPRVCQGQSRRLRAAAAAGAPNGRYCPGAAAVAAQHATDRRRCATQAVGDCCRSQTAAGDVGDLHPLVLGQEAWREDPNGNGASRSCRSTGRSRARGTHHVVMCLERTTPGTGAASPTRVVGR